MSEAVPVWIDSDIALGSPLGDIDDAFAIVALLKSKIPIAGFSTVFGNTAEPLAYRNLQALAATSQFPARIFRGARHCRSQGAPASQALISFPSPVRVLALGPLTNIATALKSACPNFHEVIFVGTNFHARLPGLRLFDFNQSKDPRSMRRLFDSPAKLVCVPCDVARNLRFTWDDLDRMPGPLNEYFKRHARRWFLRSRLLKGQRSIPVWDLAAAMYLVRPDLYRTVTTTARLGHFGETYFHATPGRPVRVVTHLDAVAIRQAFFSLFLTK